MKKMGQDTDWIVEDSLHTFPMASPPDNFSRSVMERIRTLEPVPPFRLSWLDGVISLGISLSAVIIWWWWSSLPAYVTARWQVKLILFWQSLEIAHLAIILPLALFGLGAVLLIAVLLFVFRSKSSPQI